MSRAGATARVWYTVSIPACRASVGFLNSTLVPSIRISPSSRVRAPDRHLTSVDLPAPLSPIMASTSSGYSFRLTPASATTRPNVLPRPRASSVGVSDVTGRP